MKRQTPLAAIALLALTLASAGAFASSHREAPFVTEHPKVDSTDFYMFRSYESGREGFVTLIANYQPLQPPGGGPNYFTMDPDAAYLMLFDNTGDGRVDIGFDFRFSNVLADIQLPIDDQMVSVPVLNTGEITATAENLNVTENYQVQVVRVDASGVDRQALTQIGPDSGAGHIFTKPADNVGQKSIPDYAAYAEEFKYDVAIPGCGDGRLFVGQRKESFAVNLGEVFDLVNTDPVGDRAAEGSDLESLNITSLILEVPTECLTGGATDVVGGWTAAFLPASRTLRDDPTFEMPEYLGGLFRQVSRLGNPLVNEVVIGVKDKDLFNASMPADDGQFATYVTNPTLPAILEILFGVRAPTLFPREDLLDIFIEGVPGLNEFGFGEMQRLNVTIPPVGASSQDSLGVIAGDNAGFPNGRRPGDDVVDIALRAVMGVLLDPADAPDGLLPYTDGALQEASQFDETWPYLRTPIAGSPKN